MKKLFFIMPFATLTLAGTANAQRATETQPAVKMVSKAPTSLPATTKNVTASGVTAAKASVSGNSAVTPVAALRKAVPMTLQADTTQPKPDVRAGAVGVHTMHKTSAATVKLTSPPKE